MLLTKQQAEGHMTDAPTKAAIRSPSYPNMPLREAIEAIGKIEKPYRASPIDRSNAVKLIGYSSLSGPANKALAALAAYGLLERAGKGEARVTERARDILHAESEAQRKARLIEAAMEPALYRELRERFADIPVPPIDGVITHLNRKGFNPNAVRPAAKAFLETMSYLQEVGATDSHGLSGSSEGASDNEAEPPQDAMTPQDQQLKPPPAKTGMMQEVFNLDEGPVTLSVPAKLSEESYEDLEAQLQLFLRRAKRRAERGDTEQ
jgi:hypothetical protein